MKINRAVTIGRKDTLHLPKMHGAAFTARST